MNKRVIICISLLFISNIISASQAPVIVVTTKGLTHLQIQGAGGGNPIYISNFTTLNSKIATLSGTEKITFSATNNSFTGPNGQSITSAESSDFGKMNGKYTAQYMLHGSSEWKSISFQDSFGIALTSTATSSASTFTPVKFAPYGTTSSSGSYVNYMYFDNILNYGKLFIANTGNNQEYSNNQVVPGVLSSSGVAGAPGVNGNFNFYIGNDQFPFAKGAYLFIYCVDKNNNYLSDLTSVSASNPATMHAAYYNSNLTLMYKFVVQSNITQSFTTFEFGMSSASGSSDAVKNLTYPNTLIFIVSEAVSTPGAISASSLFSGLGVSPPTTTPGQSKGTDSSSGSSTVKLATNEEIGMLDVGIIFEQGGDNYYRVIDLTTISTMASKGGSKVDYISDIQTALKKGNVLFSAQATKGSDSYGLTVSAQPSSSGSTPIFTHTVTNLSVTDVMGGYSGPAANAATVKEINIGYQTNNMNNTKMFDNTSKIILSPSSDLTITGKVSPYHRKTLPTGGSGGSGAFG